jgi:prepilin-type N-terminal cleavage/methylation domain-containing protein
MRPDDDGFTIIELVIAMMILLVITVPLVASFVLGIQTGVASQQDVTNSADAQLVGYYFDVDVSSAESTSPSSPSCGGTGTVLELRWTDGGTTRVAYRVLADPQRQAELQSATPLYRLERVKCAGGGNDVTALARTLSEVPAPQCDGAPCTDGQTPRVIDLQLKERSTQQSDLAAPTVFTFGVSATRKVIP